MITPRRRRVRRTALVAGATAAVPALGLAAWGAVLLRYRGEPPAHADAVVLLAGADDGRDSLARDLVGAGYAQVLLVSDPGGRFRRVVKRLTEGPLRPSSAEVEIVHPDPRTTWGEALAVAGIARERGWSRVLVVTNRPHALRTCLWMRAATATAGLDVRIVPITRLDVPALPRHLVWELAGFVKGRLHGHW